jgi:ribonuclease P protein component
VKLTLRKAQRMQHGVEFRRAREQGRKVTGPLMLLNVLRSDSLTGRRLGVVTSRQLGGAVVRNRARRILREAWRLIQDQVAEHCDIVIVARRGIVDRSMQEAQQELVRLLQAGGALK